MDKAKGEQAIADAQTNIAQLLEIQAEREATGGPSQWLIVANEMPMRALLGNVDFEYVAVRDSDMQFLGQRNAERLAAHLATCDDHGDARAMRIVDYVEQRVTELRAEIEAVITSEPAD